MKNRTLKPVVAAALLALASSGALAQKLDFSGSNIYIKFLDGDQRRVNDGDRSGDTASGTDNGQWTEFELRIKATISRQVEAGVRLQSRSSASYWTDFGGFGNEGATNGDQVNSQKWMKLRGAYVLLTPGYKWLDQALIGSSDWGQFDPFTVGPVRYIDRDNYNGLYFKGPLPMKGATWEFGRLSLPNYLQNNYGQGAACCSSDDTQFNEAVYIGQVKGTLGPVKLATSYQFFNDRILEDTDGTDLNGRSTRTFARSQVAMLKGEGNVAGIVDLKGALYGSTYKAPLFDQPWINSPKSDVRGKAIKLDAAFASLPVPGLSVNYQYFNIGAGFYSNTASRREADVLLTEGSEAAWHRWGQSIWHGGAAKDYQQAPSSAKCFVSGGGICRSDSGLAAGANGLVDNAFMDFDEAPAESVQGWKGHTVLVNYEVAKIPMSLELTRIGYGYNWQNLSAQDALSNYFAPSNDRRTSIGVFKVGYVVPALGGIELGAKFKRVLDKNNFLISSAADDRETRDSGFTLSAGNQLFGDLYGALSYGRYTRDIRTPALNVDNEKSITGIRLTYNLAGFQTGLLSQWVSGDGDPGETGTRASIKQYRMKAFVQAIF